MKAHGVSTIFKNISEELQYLKLYLNTQSCCSVMKDVKKYSKMPCTIRLMHLERCSLRIGIL